MERREKSIWNLAELEVVSKPGNRSSKSFIPTAIVSGGQTGVDRAALDVAIAIGIEHGGWCPAGRLAEDGSVPSRYELRETDSAEYPVRTELNVIDSYQAGEVRSTKNLSGGESFLVSLSLALGLSHMASRKVRVDSLFLDEGFGTLDEEALDTALETLAGLQQEGKLIGVISHVPALKERISTQIQIEPQTGGRSQISGPGCRKANL